MGEILATITVSVDGYVAGPDDGPGRGLGAGGERLHYWVFGGPWRYDSPERGEPTGEDRAWLDGMTRANGAVVAGRATYEAAGHWGGTNPWPVPLFVVTHRPEDQPASGGFTFVEGVAEAVEAARHAAGDRQACVMGGADVVRQALTAGLVDRLALVVAPVVLGSGKRLFEGFSGSLDLEQLGVRQSSWATFLHYRVRR